MKHIPDLYRDIKNYRILSNRAPIRFATGQAGRLLSYIKNMNTIQEDKK